MTAAGPELVARGGVAGQGLVGHGADGHGADGHGADGHGSPSRPDDATASDGRPRAAGWAPARRLAWLDGLRGLAVLAVVVQHCGELVSPGFARITHRDAQLGQGGVLLFFLVSGFVIPLTLDRHPSVRAFAVARFARLYPAYWASILVAYLAWHAGVLRIAGPFQHASKPWLINLTMLQTFFGQPQLQGQYWSLVFELIFYVLCGVLAALQLSRRSVATAVGALAGAACIHLLARATGHHAPLGLGNVATMFVGSVLYRVHAGQVSGRTGWRVFGAAVVLTQLILVTRLADAAQDRSTGVPLSLVAMMVAWAGAYLIFGAAFAARGSLRWPRWTVFVGEISYSVYLLHPIAIAEMGRRPSLVLPSAVVTVVLATLASIVLGWVSWRCVERPAGRLGRRLVSRPQDGHSRSATEVVGADGRAPAR